MQKEFDDKGLKVVKRFSVTDYNNKESVLEDVDGRWLGFGIKLDTDKWKNFNNTSLAYKNSKH